MPVMVMTRMGGCEPGSDSGWMWMRVCVRDCRSLMLEPPLPMIMPILSFGRCMMMLFCWGGAPPPGGPSLGRPPGPLDRMASISCCAASAASWLEAVMLICRKLGSSDSCAPGMLMCAPVFSWMPLMVDPARPMMSPTRSFGTVMVSEALQPYCEGSAGGSGPLRSRSPPRNRSPCMRDCTICMHIHTIGGERRPTRKQHDGPTEEEATDEEDDDHDDHRGGMEERRADEGRHTERASERASERGIRPIEYIHPQGVMSPTTTTTTRDKDERPIGS